MYDFQRLDNFLNQFDASKHDMLLVAYHHSLTEQREKCEQAVTDKDLRKIYLSTHDIKSLALTVGYASLGESARQVEKNAKDEQAEAAFSEMPNLLAHLDNLLNVIEGQIKERRQA